MSTLRLYADTSVFGGCFDTEFSVHSLKLFDEIRQGRFLLILSETLLVELQEAPDQVQQVLANLHEDHHELIEKTGKIIALRDAYVSTGVVGTSSLLDAEHIASATVAKADLIVSWNFKHIVHYEKIRGYNAVNQMNQYPGLDIRTPREVVE
ncbi:MAG: PIN domain protein [Planctomycetes bacterium]|nr:PIN domain protein [Planctomycetota bacterium]